MDEDLSDGAAWPRDYEACPRLGQEGRGKGAQDLETVCQIIVILVSGLSEVVPRLSCVHERPHEGLPETSRRNVFFTFVSKGSRSITGDAVNGLYPKYCSFANDFLFVTYSFGVGITQFVRRLVNRLHNRRIVVRFPVGASDISLLRSVKNWLWFSPSPHSAVTEGCLPGC